MIIVNRTSPYNNPYSSSKICTPSSRIDACNEIAPLFSNPKFYAVLLFITIASPPFRKLLVCCLITHSNIISGVFSRTDHLPIVKVMFRRRESATFLESGINNLNLWKLKNAALQRVPNAGNLKMSIFEEADSSRHCCCSGQFIHWFSDKDCA